MYTSANGILFRKVELFDIIKEIKKEIVCLTGIKLAIDDNSQINDYSVWRKDRGEGRGGCVLTIARSGVRIMGVEYCQGKAEIVTMQDSENIKEMKVYVPPGTNKLPAQFYEEIPKGTIHSTKKTTERCKKVVLTLILTIAR